jgi:hypothetical protein
MTAMGIIVIALVVVFLIGLVLISVPRVRPTGWVLLALSAFIIWQIFTH